MWTDKDYNRVKELVLELEGWEFIPALSKTAFESKGMLWLGSCIACMRNNGQVSLIELRGDDRQNKNILQLAKLL